LGGDFGGRRRETLAGFGEGAGGVEGEGVGKEGVREWGAAWEDSGNA